MDFFCLTRGALARGALTRGALAVIIGSVLVTAAMREMGEEAQVAQLRGHKISKRGYCYSNQFQCGNERCVAQETLCDGVNDCGDFSDEYHPDHCTICSPDDFKCPNDWCVPYTSWCDGVDDCGDHSDESSCAPCSTSEFECGNGHCVSLSAVCDRAKDCSDGSDELNCDWTDGYPYCYSSQWRCANGDCIYNFEVCDGYQHCDDNSDEIVDYCIFWSPLLTTQISLEDEGHPWWQNIFIGIGILVLVVVVFIVKAKFRANSRRQIGNGYRSCFTQSCCVDRNATQPQQNNAITQQSTASVNLNTTPDQPYHSSVTPPRTNQPPAGSYPIQGNQGFDSYKAPYSAPMQTANTTNSSMQSTYPTGLPQTDVSGGSTANQSTLAAPPTAPPLSEGIHNLPPAPTYESLYSSGAVPEPVRPALSSDVLHSTEGHPTT